MGAFKALMVTDGYSERDQQAFRAGMWQLKEACQRAHGSTSMEATPARPLALLEPIDREQTAQMHERAAPARSGAPAAAAASDELVHYLRMMKELALLAYITSEIGYTKPMRAYGEWPGVDPCQRTSRARRAGRITRSIVDGCGGKHSHPFRDPTVRERLS